MIFQAVTILSTFVLRTEAKSVNIYVSYETNGINKLLIRFLRLTYYTKEEEEEEEELHIIIPSPLSFLASPNPSVFVIASQ